MRSLALPGFSLVRSPLTRGCMQILSERLGVPSPRRCARVAVRRSAEFGCTTSRCGLDGLRPSRVRVSTSDSCRKSTCMMHPVDVHVILLLALHSVESKPRCVYCSIIYLPEDTLMSEPRSDSLDSPARAKNDMQYFLVVFGNNDAAHHKDAASRYRASSSWSRSSARVSLYFRPLHLCRALQTSVLR